MSTFAGERGVSKDEIDTKRFFVGFLSLEFL
ncbi:MAG: hypothetical protein ACTHWZ_02200 [Peptoniphilaceae bacterium]